jgi:methionyl-tRNA formyltransferase
MRVLFWGTPEFATPPLRALLGEGFEVCGVVTQPDKPRGRHRDVTPSPVKQIALEEHLPVFQPEKPKDPEFIQAIEKLQPDISVVVAYGHILPKHVIDLPRLGTLNIHASLLPLLRGAAPIQAAIRQGFKETGVSIMRMVPALDAGPVILQAKMSIPDDETYGELQARLSELGASALIEALALIQLGKAVEQEQDESLVTYAPKVEREAGRIDWTNSAQDVVNTIRAYDPKPTAFTTLHGVDVKLFGATVKVFPELAGERKAGEVIAIDDRLMVMAGDGNVVAVTDVQPAGKKRMRAQEWGRGRGVVVGDLLGAP